MSRLDKVLISYSWQHRCTGNYLKTLGTRYSSTWFINYCRSVRDESYEEPCCKCIYYADNINEYVREL